MTQAYIIEENINNNFLPKVIFAMIYVKNIKLTNVFEGKIPYES